MTTATRSHGGPDASGVPRHDFSTNGNATGPCPQALAAVHEADAARYPDPAYTQLRETLARFHGVATGRIVPAASASEFIFRITAWAARQGAREVWLPPHGYGDYAQAASAWGLAATGDPRRAALAWACEPSSPLGQPEVHIDALMAAQGVVVLDRAYEPLRLSGASSFTAGLLERVWQLWSPNKALGLTGVRAAYAIAPAGTQGEVDQLEALAPSWPLGSHGVAMLRAWCEPSVQEWLAQSRATLRDWKARQAGVCASLGWTVLASDANFFAARVEGLPRWLPLLRERGIKLRDCASFGLPGHARLGVRPPAAQDALREAWLATAPGSNTARIFRLHSSTNP